MQSILNFISKPCRLLCLAVLLILHFGVVAQDTSEGRESTLEPITVRSDIDKQKSPLILAPGSFIRIEREQIKSTLPDKLESAAGKTSNVEFIGGPRLQSQLPQIRGLNSQRILILEEGVRQNFRSGHNGRVFTDFSLLETVEVVKGPWSSLYGSGAMGGVISFRRSTAADLLKDRDKSWGGELAVDGGTANSSFGQRLTGFAKFSWFEPLVSYRRSESKDIRLGDGQPLQFSGSNTEDIYTSLTARIDDKQDFNLKLNRYTDDSRQPLNPTLEADTSNLPADYSVEKQDIVGNYKIARGKWLDFQALPYFRRVNIEKTRVSDRRVDRQLVDTRGLDAWNNLSLEFAEIKSVITTGVELFHDRNDGSRSGGPLELYPDGESEHIGLYAQPSVTYRKFTFSPGVRHDSYKLSDSTGQTLANSASETSLKAYGTYEFLPESVVFVGWGQAFNAPTLQDIYASGMHFPGNFFVANPELKPELAETYEAGVKHRAHVGYDSLITTNLTYFRTETKDFIARFVDIPGGTTRFENLDRVRIEGIEGSLAYQQVIWGASLSYGQARSLDKNTGEPLTDTAADNWMASMSLFPTENLSLATHLRYTEKQEDVPSGTDPSPAYFAQDFSVSYVGKKFDGRVRLNNAFDRDYRHHASPIKETGRDLRLSLTWKF